MNTPDQQRRVDVRELWPNEALDFTPWLADNLDLLGTELDLRLELVAREKPVGPYFLDILAKRIGNDELVAIENQLEWANFGHLAQLLVYSAGCGAQVAVWVATEFPYELAEVLHRLNEWTVSGVSFYGVKIEAVQTADGSKPEPRFRKVVYPGSWDEDETMSPGRLAPPEVQKHRKFFEPLIDAVHRTGLFQPRPTQRFDHTGRYFRSLHTEGLSYAVTLSGVNDAWATLHVETGDTELTKHIFDTLYEDRRRIEAAIDVGPGSNWAWHRSDPWGFASINARRDGSINDPPERHDETRRWMLDLLPKLKDVFEPLIAEILADAAAQDQEPETSPVDSGAETT